MKAQLLALRELDGRVLAIGDRLATANADLCQDKMPIPGLALHDIAQYGADYRDAARQAFGLEDDMATAVLAVDPESAAGKAGVRADDILLAADGVVIGQRGATGSKGSFDQLEQDMDRLDEALADGGARLELLRANERVTVEIHAPPGCRGRFQLVPGNRMNAGADGRYIQISSALTAYAEDDVELAAILAHELAHNILHHRARLDAAGVSRGFFKSVGRNARLIRQTEVEADRLSVYLLDRAGYPIEAATRFWGRFGPEHGPGILGSATHPGWEKRVATIEAEAAILTKLKQGNSRPVPSILLQMPPLR